MKSLRSKNDTLVQTIKAAWTSTKKSGGVRRGSFVNIQKQSVVGVFLKAGYLAWFHESNPISNRLALVNFNNT